MLRVSVLYREPKLLKGTDTVALLYCTAVSVLYREPKLLKDIFKRFVVVFVAFGFSALP